MLKDMMKLVDWESATATSKARFLSQSPLYWGRHGQPIRLIGNVMHSSNTSNTSLLQVPSARIENSSPMRVDIRPSQPVADHGAEWEAQGYITN